MASPGKKSDGTPKDLREEPKEQWRLTFPALPNPECSARPVPRTGRDEPEGCSGGAGRRRNRQSVSYTPLAPRDELNCTGNE